jgi:eukaryotic-like serine/threonine-protein kinase
MNELSGEYDPIDDLADDFLERYRRGERPSLSEYTNKYPDLAERIRAVFPALVVMETVGAGRSEGTGLDVEPFGSGVSMAHRLGDFVLIRRVGAGGMGIVYEAEHESLKSRMALKVMHPRFRTDQTYVRRFQTEARSAAKLHHTNIVSVFGYGEQDGVCYYAMQYIVGVGLERVLEDVRRLRSAASDDIGARIVGVGKRAAIDADRLTAISRGLLSGRFVNAPAASHVTGPDSTLNDAVGGESHDINLGERTRGNGSAEAPTDGRADSDSSSLAGQTGSIYFREVARLGAQVADALEHAHRQGVIHRDIKPSNLLLDIRGNVWVTDFGLAKLVEGDELTQSRDLIGTLRFMAPERFRGVTDMRGDVYSLGATLYELLTLKPAFAERDQARLIDQIARESPVPLRQHDYRIPRDLETLVLKALAKDPRDRFVSPAELGDELRRYLESRPIRSRPIMAAERLWRWCKRSPGLAVLSTTVALVTILGFCGILWQWSAAEEARSEATTKARAESMARKDAVEQAIKATEARDAAEEALYRNRVALADQHLTAHQADLAERLLDDCPPGLRGWEWNYLKRLCYTDGGPNLPRTSGPIAGLAYSGDGRRLAVAAEDGVLIVLDGTSGLGLFALGGHSGQVRSVAFSPDSRMLASCGGNPDVFATAANPQSGETILWEATTGREMSRMERKVQVTCVAFSPDGRLLAAGGLDDTVDLHESSTGRRIRTLNCFEELEPRRRVAGIAFSPDGRLLASASWDGAIRVWDVATGRKINILRHRWPAYSVAFSPDGRRLASAGGETIGSLEGELKCWDVATGLELFSLRGHVGMVLCVAFSPDGRRLASAGADRRIRVWESVTGHPILALSGHEHDIRTIVFSPDGRRLATGSTDHSVRIWDASPSRTHTLTNPRLTVRKNHQQICALEFSLDGRRLASAGADQRVHLWDTATGQELFAARGHTDTIQALAFSPDGRRIATGGDDRTIRVWDAATGKLVRGLRRSGARIMGLAFSPDSRRLAAAFQDDTASIWDADSDREDRILRGHKGWVMAVAFSPDGRRLATGGEDRVIRLWDVVTGQEVKQLAGHDQRIVAVTFSPDGRRLGSTSQDGTVLLWDPADGRRIRAFDGVGGRGLAFSRDGRLLAASAGARVKVWDLATGWRVLTLGEGAVEIGSVAFGADERLATGGSDGTIGLWDTKAAGEAFAFGESRRLAGHPSPAIFLAVDRAGRIVSGGDDATVRVWDSGSGAQLRQLVGHGSFISAVAVTPDGRRAVSGGWDGDLCQWDLESGTLIRRLASNRGGVFGLAISPDGRQVLSGGSGHFDGGWKSGTDLGVRLWDLESGTPLRRLDGHTGMIWNVAFSPDGRRALSTSLDGTARVWDLADGAELLQFTGHGSSVNCGAFLPAGTRVLSGGEDRKLRLWDAATGQELRRFDGHSAGVLWIAISADGRQALSGGFADRTIRLWDLATGQELACFRYEGVSPTRGAFLPDGRHAVWTGTDGFLRIWELPVSRQMAPGAERDLPAPSERSVSD